jgi:hypothetical protein
MLRQVLARWKLRSEISGTLEYWDDWHRETRESFPIRYFLQYDVPRFWSRWITRPLKDAWWWLRYRTTDRNHILRLDSLGPGYYDEDTMMLHACFQILVDFVEIDLANHNVEWWEKRKPKYLPWWLYRRFASRRSPDAGLDYLEWEITYPETQNTMQCEAAREKKALYHWWKVERPTRVNPWTAERIWAKVERDPFTFLPRSPEAKRAGDIASTTEHLYQIEDQAMLERLIKVRETLWC